MYGKLINNKIEYLKMPIVLDGRNIFTNDDSLIKKAGYKELINTPYPTDGKRYVQGEWQETETQIVSTWVEKPYTEEELQERYKNLTKQYIAEKYDFADELAVKNNYEYDSANVNYAEEYSEYQQYRIDCKTRARKEVYGEQ